MESDGAVVSVDSRQDLATSCEVLRISSAFLCLSVHRANRVAYGFLLPGVATCRCILHVVSFPFDRRNLARFAITISSAQTICRHLVGVLTRLGHTHHAIRVQESFSCHRYSWAARYTGSPTKSLSPTAIAALVAIPLPDVSQVPHSPDHPSTGTSSFSFL